MWKKLAELSNLDHVQLDTLKKQHDSRTNNIDILMANTQRTNLIKI